MNIAMHRILLIILCFMLGTSAYADGEYDKLDALIEQSDKITTERINYIKTIRQQLLTPGLTGRQCYEICNRLYTEYASFKFDSALVYSDKLLRYAERTNDRDCRNEALIKKAHIHSLAGLFTEAKEILEDVRVEELNRDLLVSYYEAWNLQLTLMSEFSSHTVIHERYSAEALEYKKKILKIASPDSYLYKSTQAAVMSSANKNREALNYFEPYLSEWETNEHEYAMIASNIASYYEQIGDKENCRKYLIMSAMADIEAATKETQALRKLASLLFEEGDVERAYRYLNISIDEANFYGTRLRNSQASELIPEIQKVYAANKEAQSRHIRIQMAVLTVIALLLIVGVVVISKLLRRYRDMNKQVYKMNQKLNDAVEDLQQANGQMREGNKLKDEYISRFLELSSTIIDRADVQHKFQNRLAREKKMEELYSELKSNAFIAECTKIFYENFDGAFLNIYPNFVSDVNELLVSDGKIIPKQGERLTTELRILALIRLGIQDNSKISSILRSSITTIYTYRSKLKARAKDRDNFEELVKMIGVYE